MMVHVYAYVHGITEFGENEPSVQKSVFMWNTVSICKLDVITGCVFLSS